MESNTRPPSDYRPTPVAYLELVRDLCGLESASTTASAHIKTALGVLSHLTTRQRTSPPVTRRAELFAEHASLLTTRIHTVMEYVTSEAKTSIPMVDASPTEESRSSEPHPRGQST